MQHIDIHTHRLKKGKSIQVLNIFAQDLSVDEHNFFYSAGLHPWHIGKVNADDCFQAIELAAQQKNMLAIGECGLDRSISTDFILQEKYFRKQIELAKKHSKPLIIHCVRAYSDLLKLKKETKSDQTWIIHGYHGNLEITKNLVSHGFYFSVGERFLKDEAKHEVLVAIPIDRLFLETDDSEISIEEIYSLAGNRQNVVPEKLAEQILDNFTRLFGTANY